MIRVSQMAIVDYSDLEHFPITNDQYRANLFNQIRDPSLSDDTPTVELERIVDEIARRCTESHLQKVPLDFCFEGLD